MRKFNRRARARSHANNWGDAFKEIVADAEVRRELMWLRAAEDGDYATAEKLMIVDSGIVARLEPLAHTTWQEAGCPDVENADVRRELYRVMHDARLLMHLLMSAGARVDEQLNLPIAYGCPREWPKA